MVGARKGSSSPVSPVLQPLDGNYIPPLGMACGSWWPLGFGWGAASPKFLCPRGCWGTRACLSASPVSPTPSALRYFGFITKHPADHRFACHVFVSEESTKPLAESVG